MAFLVLFGWHEVLKRFGCGLSMEICLDVVADEMNLDIQERECLVQRIGILMKEVDAWVSRIQVAYEGFQMLLSMSSNHEDIITELPPNELKKLHQCKVVAKKIEQVPSLCESPGTKFCLQYFVMPCLQDGICSTEEENMLNKCSKKDFISITLFV